MVGVYAFVSPGMNGAIWTLVDEHIRQFSLDHNNANTFRTPKTVDAAGVTVQR